MVTMFSDIHSISDPKVVELPAVLDAIKTGRYKDKVNAVRGEADDTKRRELKGNLPCVLFCGEFTNGVEKEKDGKKYTSFRDDRSLKKHSGLVPIDLDNVADIAEKMAELSQIPYVYALWVSSSGKGIHGLVKIGDPNKHVQHYRALLSKIEGLDKTAQNPSRVLYVSYDPNIYVNEACD